MTNKTITITGTERLVLTDPGTYQVNLAAPGAEVTITGAFQACGSDKLAVQVVITHQAPHTRATTTLHGVAGDTAQLSFVGRIIIEADCGDSQSFLTERILLLSDTAKAEAIPDLEIKTDDVKCSHAASISRIPEEHLFYLRSRGLDQAAAEALIIEGFLELE